MQCTSPVKIANGSFPCGHCLSCRIAKAREWSARLMHELESWNGQAVFITLTYSDSYLPRDYGLHKETLQKFFKRLRKSLNGRKIKYYACGEYGDHAQNEDGSYKFPTRLGRPHYHAIVFGLSRRKEDIELIKSSWRFCVWEMFNESKVFGTVTYDSCRYVSDYIFKKYNKEKAVEVYGDLQPPFKICSQGLGLDYCMREAENLRHNVGFTMRGVKMALPRYYVEKLEIELESQNDKNFSQWLNYAKSKHVPLEDIADLKEAHRKQRELNTEARCNLRKKGSI